MPEPLPPPEELRRLTEFVWYLHAIMQAVVQPPHGILRGRHHDVLSAAWAEVKPTFEELARALGAAPPIRQRLGQLGLTGFRLQLELAIFDHARARLLDHADGRFHVAPFHVVGIVQEFPSAPKDSFMVTNLNYLRAVTHEFFVLETPLPVAEPRAEERKPGFCRRFGRRLRRCLKAGDVVLGSLTAFFPPAEAITQFKEVKEEGITLVRGEKES